MEVFTPIAGRRTAFSLNYATCLPTVEVNATFYRMPAESTLRAWAEQTPRQFRFAVKAHRRITHVRRLRDVRRMCGGPRNGCRCSGNGWAPCCSSARRRCRDLELLEDFLASLPSLPRVAVEFLHPTWFQPGTYRLLTRYRVALCAAEDGEGSDPLVWTAPFGYLRLHRLRYGPEDLSAWAARLRGATVGEVFCYFTHKTGPDAVRFARALMERCA
ncbi:MAG: DUF72 domain-containing protein [candidate division GAL15 bacterium]